MWTHHPSMGMVVRFYLKPFAMGFHNCGLSWAATSPIQQHLPALARRELLSPHTGDLYLHPHLLATLVFGQSPSPHKHRPSAEAQHSHCVVLSSTAIFTLGSPCPDLWEVVCHSHSHRDQRHLRGGCDLQEDIGPSKLWQEDPALSFHVTGDGEVLRAS